ncbi:phage integrase SAM-like domain-containing protein [Blautia intestinihominis]|jgi:integrase|uniref:phage integrase SAM-like domain-containing protein n=1 Tax=Blautia intestinihominis TaxID=3133152 RepID=UPI003F498F71
MASIQKKNNKYCVVYYCKDTDGKRKQKWETYDTKNAAKIRKAEIELKEKKGGIIVSNCKTLEDLINEYVELYGKDRWALSTYDGNMSLLKNYILPIIGKTPLTDINTRFLEIYYKTLTKTPSVPDLNGNVRSEFVSTSVIRDVHKLLKSCFNQAVKWDIMEKNPAFKATVPKHKSEKRVIWDAETFAYALDVCENECLKLCMNLAFAGSLRIGELLGLTWDCVDISEEAIKENRAYLYVNKEVQRVSKKALEELDQKDVIVIFPEERKTNKTVRIMKTPKTESSVPPLKKDTPSDVVAFIWAYMKVPENSREKVKNLLKDANKNGVKLSHQAPTLYDVVPKEEIAEFEELMRKTIADIVSEASSVAYWVYVQKYVKQKTLDEMLQELPGAGQSSLL